MAINLLLSCLIQFSCILCELAPPDFFCPPPPSLAGYATGLRYSMYMFYNLFYRHILASLHFNENINRESQTAKDGNAYVHVTYPKFKLGDEVVREVSVPPTYREFSFFLMHYNCYILTHRLV
jgi:hypothetical protein